MFLTAILPSMLYGSVSASVYPPEISPALIADPSSSRAVRPSEVNVPSKLPITALPTRKSTTRKFPSPFGASGGPLAFSRNETWPSRAKRDDCNV